NPSNSLTRTEPQIRSKDSATLPPPQPTNPLFRDKTVFISFSSPPPRPPRARKTFMSRMTQYHALSVPYRNAAPRCTRCAGWK
ncbi:hypothetical protein COCVIDRAFT_98446, partial [Bipolaris victoriae FI3]